MWTLWGGELIFNPFLDGLDNIYTIDGTTTVSNGEMSGGASYLSDGWDNTGDWELTVDVYHNASDGQALCLFQY